MQGMGVENIGVRDKLKILKEKLKTWKEEEVMVLVMLQDYA